MSVGQDRGRGPVLSVLMSARVVPSLDALLDDEVGAVVSAPGHGLLAAAAIAARRRARLVVAPASSDPTSDRDRRSTADDGLRARLRTLGVAPGRARSIHVARTADGGVVVRTSDLGDGGGERVAHLGAEALAGTGPAAHWSEAALLAGRAARRTAFDIDGVLCWDPTPEEDDGGERYARFLREAGPLLLPSAPVGSIVTSRLERDRAVTERWLAHHGVRYRRLVMIDLPSHEERLRPWIAERAKAAALRASRSRLHVESDPKQAKRIASLTGIAVLCLTTGDYHPPRWRARAVHRWRGGPSAAPGPAGPA